MKNITIEKFSGLQVQPNSLTVSDGALEVADNVVLSQDYLITKRRGYAYKHFFQNNLNTLFEYENQIFGLAESYCVRFDPTDYGIGKTFAGSQKIVVRSASHGLTDQDYVAEFTSSDENFISQFASRYSAFCGINQVTVAYNDLVASGNGSRVLVALVNHGMDTGDAVSIGDSTISVPLGVYPIAACGANAFAVVSTVTGTGTVDLVTLDSFAFSVSEAAVSGSTSVASGVSWDHYERLGGSHFDISDRSRTLQSNKNQYFTTDNGLFCFESPTSEIREAGIPPGLDVDGFLSGTTGGVNANAQAAWRIVFGLKDSNDNLHLGAPSEALLLVNSLTEVGAPAISYASGTGVATITASGHGLSTGDELYLYSVDLAPATAAVADGSRIFCTSIDSNTFSVDFDELGVAPTGVSGLSYGTRKTATLYASIPSEINSTEFLYQIYRVQSADAGTPPESRYKVLDEKKITQTDLSRGFIEYVDQLPEELIEGNAELYTNPTQEGESQANSRPPLSGDVALFKNFIFFADNTQYRSLSFALVAPAKLADGDTLTVAGEIYEFYSDTLNQTVGNKISTDPATTSTYVEVTHTGHGFQANDVINVISVVGISGIAAGQYTISAVPTANTFRFGTGATGSGTVTYEGLEAANGNRIVTLTTASSLSSYPTNQTTLAESIDASARALVKAINRNAAATVYAQYVSAIDEAPGNILLTAKDLDAAAYAITASSTTAGEAFSPDLPTSGTTVSDSQTVAPNELLVSKYLEPEAVPIVNVFPIGSKAARILRIAALRDSLIVLKEDGIFRLNGDSPSNYVVTQLDGTVILKATNSVAVLNNSVFALTNQGVVQISDTSVRIISRQIEPLLTSVFQNQNLDAYTFGLAYESERLYLLSTIAPNSTPQQANVTYIYHYLTETWTTWSGAQVVNFAGVISATEDKAYLVTAANRAIVTKERKNQTKIDYTGQDSCIPILVRQPANAYCEAASTHLVVQTRYAHGLKVGEVVTLSSSDASLYAAYSGGAADVEGVRVVIAKSAKTFTVDSLSTSTGSATGNLYWQSGISEVSVAMATTASNATVTCTTPQAHGFANGDALTVVSVDSTIAGDFAGGSADLTGYRSITVIDATTFSINADSNASAGVTGTGELKDRRGQKTYVTALSTSQPQVGDAIVTENRIYLIKAVDLFLTGVWILTLSGDYKSLSTAQASLHDAYRSQVKFAPISGGTGTLKTFIESQIWFRNQSSCSSAEILFGTDSIVASQKDSWRSDVGTPTAPVIFGGWGESAWGEFPWGGGQSIQRDYRSGPAVIWRLYIPRTAYMATWIQPQITHDTAGEPLEIQSLALMANVATTRVSK